MVSTLASWIGVSDPGLSACWGHYVIVLNKTFDSHCDSLSTGLPENCLDNLTNCCEAQWPNGAELWIKRSSLSPGWMCCFVRHFTLTQSSSFNPGV